MRRIFGFQWIVSIGFMVLSIIHKSHAYNCSSYYILLNQTNAEVEVVANPSIVDTSLFTSINSSIPKTCYIGLSCLGSMTECTPILRRKVVYGSDTHEREPVTKKTDVTWTLPKPHHDADEKDELNTRCLKDIKDYLISNKCDEKNDTSKEATAFYRCNVLPYEDCESTISDEYLPNNLTRERRENCESYIMHVKKVYHNSSDFLPHSLRPNPANFDGFSCTDNTNTCFLDFNCTGKGKNCVNVYRYRPSTTKNNTECLSSIKLPTSTASSIETKPPSDSINATTTETIKITDPIEVIKDSTNTTINETLTTTVPTNITKDVIDSTNSTMTETVTTTDPIKIIKDSTNTTITEIPTTTAPTNTTKAPTDSTNATTTETITTTAPTKAIKDPTDFTNTTTTETLTTTAPTTVTKDPVDYTNATTIKTITTTLPTTVTKDPTEFTNGTTGILVTQAPTNKPNGTYKTNTKNVDSSNSEIYTNEGLKGFVSEILGNTSETNFIVYVVLIAVALFVGGMLFCLAVMKLSRCNKKRKYEARQGNDSPGGEETQLPMDIINIIGPTKPNEEYFLLTSKEVRLSMRSCHKRKSYLKSEDFT